MCLIMISLKAKRSAKYRESLKNLSMFIPLEIELWQELESALVLPCSKHELVIRKKAKQFS